MIFVPKLRFLIFYQVDLGPLGVSLLFVEVHQLTEIFVVRFLDVGLMILLKVVVSFSFMEAVMGLKTCFDLKKNVGELVTKIYVISKIRELKNFMHKFYFLQYICSLVNVLLFISCYSLKYFSQKSHSILGYCPHDVWNFFV